METTEQLIVEQLKQGNEEAYKYLYRHHYALLCHVASGYVGDDFLAETLVGDVIFHLWEIRETLAVQTSLRSYLMRAVRNRCLDYLASKREKSEVAFSSLGGDEEMKERYIVSDDYPLGTLLEQELEEEIRSAIRRLPEMCRKVFLMSRFGGKSYEEIADALHPCAGICLDTGHAHIAGEDIPAFIAKAGSLLIGTHIADNNGKEDQHLLPGFGTIRWEDVMKAFRTSGYRGFLNFECMFFSRNMPQLLSSEIARLSLMIGDWLLSL